MSWVQAITGLLGALGTFWGAVSYHQGRGHRRRLEQLEAAHDLSPAPRPPLPYQTDRPPGGA